MLIKIKYLTLLFALLCIGQITSNSYVLAQETDFFSQPLSPANPDDEFVLAGNDTIPARPIIAVRKTINETQVNPLQWIQVNVTIQNIGNRTAYNLTIFDSMYNDWAIATKSYEVQKYVQIDINTTIFYSYHYKILREGNFSILPTTVDYVDVNGTEYFSRSIRFNVLSIVIEDVELIEKELWLNVLWYSLSITGALVIAVLVDYIFLRRRKLIKVDKGGKRVESAPKSKRAQKRRIQKKK